MKQTPTANHSHSTLTTHQASSMENEILFGDLIRDEPLTRDQQQEKLTKVFRAEPSDATGTSVFLCSIERKNKLTNYLHFVVTASLVAASFSLSTATSHHTSVDFPQLPLITLLLMCDTCI